MKVKQEMKKIEMIEIMMYNEYPIIYNRVPRWMYRRNRPQEEIDAWVLKDLLYHTLKEDLYEIFRDYLYWKIENNQKILFKKMLENA
jgi:hypothetical protein